MCAFETPEGAFCPASLELLKPELELLKPDLRKVKLQFEFGDVFYEETLREGL